ncbi:hypothetical protein [Wolbachia endosymbiont (group A) of Tiphia femorata]|uniref:hypothetical protein n=1 Tax=Wolbachia endosymbiont (group A) of Tiphia femorata TaxID=2954063 RepID=UPI00222EDBED|nr:hypothetical protein [Wolbachia endosymbiont (group A) of Tiphia femorata]
MKTANGVIPVWNPEKFAYKQANLFGEYKILRHTSTASLGSVDKKYEKREKDGSLA